MSTESQLQDQIARLQNAIQQKQTPMTNSSRGSHFQGIPRGTTGIKRGTAGIARGYVRGRAIRGSRAFGRGGSSSFHPYPRALTLNSGSKNVVKATRQVAASNIDKNDKRKRYERLDNKKKEEKHLKSSDKILTRVEEHCSQFTRKGKTNNIL